MVSRRPRHHARDIDESRRVPMLAFVHIPHLDIFACRQGPIPIWLVAGAPDIILKIIGGSPHTCMFVGADEDLVEFALFKSCVDQIIAHMCGNKSA
jgi:hypothetical protein